MAERIANVMAAIAYIEDHLREKLDLDTVAAAVHYSKFHLHRMFTDTVGMTIQTYVQRRQLTEAAKLLVFSSRPIGEIALTAGYESQQAFSDAFKALYKVSPGEYREARSFYPLQLRYVLNDHPTVDREIPWKEQITAATEEDLPRWMNLVRLVVDGFPHLDEEQHLRQLRQELLAHRGWILRDGDTAVAVMIFREETGSIDFFGVHPQYPKREIAEAFCQKALEQLARTPQISVTTFRKGDRADTGYRAIWESLGFAEAELLVEFGYPTQRFVLRRERDA